MWAQGGGQKSEGGTQRTEIRGRKGAYLMRSADFGMRNVERIGHNAKCRAQSVGPGTEFPRGRRVKAES